MVLTVNHVGQAVYCPHYQLAGVVYAVFPAAAGRRQRPGCSVVLSDGQDLGCFSACEADQLLLTLGSTTLEYQFTGVAQLREAVQEGRFALAFEQATAQARAAGHVVEAISC